MSPKRPVSATNDFGMGVAAGDYDNDGYVDLYVTNYGHNVLYHNNGNGTFTDVTKTAGVESSGWSTSAAFIDYDRDGLLDLVVGPLRGVLSQELLSRRTGRRDYCGPQNFRIGPSPSFFATWGTGGLKTSLPRLD